MKNTSKSDVFAFCFGYEIDIRPVATRSKQTETFFNGGPIYRDFTVHYFHMPWKNRTVTGTFPRGNQNGKCLFFVFHILFGKWRMFPRNFDCMMRFSFIRFVVFVAKHSYSFRQAEWMCTGEYTHCALLFVTLHFRSDLFESIIFMRSICHKTSDLNFDALL